VQEFVKELFRVYLKNTSPTEEEIAEYADPLLRGEMSLASMEDEFKLKSLSVPK